MATDKQCRICGVHGQYHQGAVDCINALRKHAAYLQSLLPEGKEMLRASLTRTSSARIWIDGEVTVEGINRLIQFVEFMREAYAIDESAGQPSTPERVSSESAESRGPSS